MKRVFTNSYDVIHLYAQRSQDEGRCSNVFFYGDKIYSYGHHYLLGEFIDDGKAIIINDEGLLVRLETLNEMNKEFDSDPPLKDSIICHIGILIVAYLYLRLWILSMLSDYLEGIFKEIAAFINLMIKIPMFLRFSIFAVTGLIVGILGCFGFPPYIIN